MKRNYFINGILLFIVIACSQTMFAQNPINWSTDQLMEPGQLALAIKNNKAVPAIISVGPGAPIPHSADIGMVKDQESMQLLKQHLTKLDKSSEVVVYCGCCPFEHCPNVRPAISMLKQMKFTNYKLLNLPKNIKTDWIDKGYPTKE